LRKRKHTYQTEACIPVTGTLDRIYGTSIGNTASWPKPGSNGIDTDDNPAPVVNPRGTYLKRGRFLQSGCHQMPVSFRQKDQGRPRDSIWNKTTSSFVPQDQLWASPKGNHKEGGQSQVAWTPRPNRPVPARAASHDLNEYDLEEWEYQSTHDQSPERPAPTEDFRMPAGGFSTKA
jgi:hypothetical protein